MPPSGCKPEKCLDARGHSAHQATLDESDNTILIFFLILVLYIHFRDVIALHKLRLVTSTSRLYTREVMVSVGPSREQFLVFSKRRKGSGAVEFNPWRFAMTS
jgi:hypothetical protein